MQLNKKQIESLGHLISWYDSDLQFFHEFQKFENKSITDEQYCLDSRASFQKFINTYQVTRTLKSGNTVTLFKICKDWHDQGLWEDVNGLADAIESKKIGGEKIVHGKPVSLASKVMFLMRPDLILPYDRRAKAALGMTSGDKDYKKFQQRAVAFEKKNREVLDEGLAKVSDMLDVIECGYPNLNLPFQQVRRMRLLDKLLWTGPGEIISH